MQNPCGPTVAFHSSTPVLEDAMRLVQKAAQVQVQMPEWYAFCVNGRCPYANGRFLTNRDRLLAKQSLRLTPISSRVLFHRSIQPLLPTVRIRNMIFALSPSSSFLAVFSSLFMPAQMPPASRLSYSHSQAYPRTSICRSPLRSSNREPRSAAKNNAS